MEYLEQRKNILISQQMPQVLSWIPETTQLHKVCTNIYGDGDELHI